MIKPGAQQVLRAQVGAPHPQKLASESLTRGRRDDRLDQPREVAGDLVFDQSANLGCLQVIHIHDKVSNRGRGRLIAGGERVQNVSTYSDKN